MNAEDIDYSYYLGENYRDGYKDPSKEHTNGAVSTMVANHSSGFDVQVITELLKTKASFIAGSDALLIPGLNRFIKGN